MNKNCEKYETGKERAEMPVWWSEILRSLSSIIKGSCKNLSFAKLGILSQQGGGLTESQLFFVKLAKTKFAFVNGKKCDEKQNT